MNRMRSTKISAIIIMILLFSGVLAADDQGWINNSLTLSVDKKISLKFTNEIRTQEITFADGFLHNWQGGVVWKASSSTYLAALYKRETTDKGAYNLQENRLTLEAGWKLSMSNRTRFDVRFRTEIRGFEDDRADHHLRFRLRLRFTTQLTLGKLVLKPFIATEPFADTIADKINRNRFYLGTAVPLSAHVVWVVNYIRQDTSGKDPLHVLNTGVELKF
ncbi:MAG: DUF2490 domain-containing protein [Candidatus Aminicenantes bacterium]|nr:DUF2490 domain-containing protein [Candidatus Aminicenantes bacterium]